MSESKNALTFLRIDTECFSSSYDHARQKFLKAASDAGAHIESVKHPLAGPGGEDLFLDVARIGPRDPARLLVTVSGTHGPEGYCGSAAQIATLRQLDAGKLNAETAAVFVHAHNPFGFAWGVRCTHENVDLNRNFVDHDNAPENRIAAVFYDRLGELPAVWTDEFIDHFEATRSKLVQEFGESEAGYWLGFGQYDNKSGLHFGGQRETWSRQAITAALAEYRPGARKVAAVDFHTGLGRYGYGELLSPFDPGSDNYRRAAEVYGPSVCSMPGGQSVATYSAGNVSEWIVEYFSEAAVVAHALEFGTFEGPSLQRAKLRCHWLASTDAFEHSESEEIRRAYRAVFYPEFDDWKEMVLQRATMVVRQSLDWVEHAHL